MGGVLKTSYQSVSDTGNIQKTRKESRAPPTTEVTGLRAWLRMNDPDGVTGKQNSPNISPGCFAEKGFVQPRKGGRRHRLFTGPYAVLIRSFV